MRYFYHISPSGECSVIGRGIVIDPCTMLVQEYSAGDIWRDAGVADEAGKVFKGAQEGPQ